MSKKYTKINNIKDVPECKWFDLENYSEAKSLSEWEWYDALQLKIYWTKRLRLTKNKTWY